MTMTLLPLYGAILIVLCGLMHYAVLFCIGEKIELKDGVIILIEINILFLLVGIAAMAVY